MKVFAVVALAALVATPALAAGSKSKARFHNSYNQMAPWDGPRATSRGDSISVRSYSGRRVIGRDPDPNIRQSLRDEDAYFRNGD